jgi:hypothetical protein
VYATDTPGTGWAFAVDREGAVLALAADDSKLARIPAGGQPRTLADLEARLGTDGKLFTTADGRTVVVYRDARVRIVEPDGRVSILSDGLPYDDAVVLGDDNCFYFRRGETVFKTAPFATNTTPYAVAAPDSGAHGVDLVALPGGGCCLVEGNVALARRFQDDGTLNGSFDLAPVWRALDGQANKPRASGGTPYAGGVRLISAVSDRRGGMFLACETRNYDVPVSAPGSDISLPEYKRVHTIWHVPDQGKPVQLFMQPDGFLAPALATSPSGELYVGFGRVYFSLPVPRP